MSSSASRPARAREPATAAVTRRRASAKRFRTDPSAAHGRDRSDVPIPCWTGSRYSTLALPLEIKLHRSHRPILPRIRSIGRRRAKWHNALFSSGLASRRIRRRGRASARVKVLPLIWRTFFNSVVPAGCSRTLARALHSALPKNASIRSKGESVNEPCHPRAPRRADDTDGAASAVQAGSPASHR